MPDATKGRGKIEALWTALLGSCVAAGYDFQYYKISQPPPVDAEPVTIPFPPERIIKNPPD